MSHISKGLEEDDIESPVETRKDRHRMKVGRDERSLQRFFVVSKFLSSVKINVIEIVLSCFLILK
jgi:hypothetical protein